MWRGIATVWDDTNLHICWHPGAGHTTKFWLDNWLENTGPLCLHSFGDIPKDELDKPIRDFINPDGTWQTAKFGHLLPEDLLHRIELKQPPLPEDGQETGSWDLTPTGNFTVSSAYTAATEHQWNTAESHFRLPWKWPGSQRIRTFLWLALQGKLLTNAERVRRHLTTDAACPACGWHTEDLNHVFRECPVARRSWYLLAENPPDPSHPHTSFVDWLLYNLSPVNNSQVWRLTFGILCWKLWHNRNTLVFQDTSQDATTIALQVTILTEHTHTKP